MEEEEENKREVRTQELLSLQVLASLYGKASLFSETLLSCFSFGVLSLQFIMLMGNYYRKCVKSSPESTQLSRL